MSSIARPSAVWSARRSGSVTPLISERADSSTRATEALSSAGRPRALAARSSAARTLPRDRVRLRSRKSRYPFTADESAVTSDVTCATSAWIAAF